MKKKIKALAYKNEDTSEIHWFDADETIPRPKHFTRCHAHDVEKEIEVDNEVPLVFWIYPNPIGNLSQSLSKRELEWFNLQDHIATRSPPPDGSIKMIKAIVIPDGAQVISYHTLLCAFSIATDARPEVAENDLTLHMIADYLGLKKHE